MTFTLELTTSDAQALAGLLDAAVRHGGLQAAPAAVMLADKINAAMQPKDEMQPKTKGKDNG